MFYKVECLDKTEIREIKSVWRKKKNCKSIDFTSKNTCISQIKSIVIYLVIDYSNETVLFGKHKFNQENILVIYYAKLIVGAVKNTKWTN